MKKIALQFLVLGVFGFLMTGCGGLQKMADEAQSVKWSVTPNPLEMHAGKVPVKITVKFPPKYFNKKAILVTTPILKYGSQQKELKTATVQGEDVLDNNQKVSFESGGTVNFIDTLEYQDAMRVSSLEASIKAQLGDDAVDLPAQKLADGIITTPELVKYGVGIDNKSKDGSMTGKVMTSTVTMDPVIEAFEQAIVYFDLQQSSLKYTEWSKAEVKKLLDVIEEKSKNEDTDLKNVQVASYASPDGPEDMNKRLVDGRGDAAQQKLNAELKRKKIEELEKESFLVRETTPEEDWDGFKRQVEDSEMKDKDLVLRVLSMYSDPQVREKEIKNISEAYTELKSDILPQLRRAVMKAVFETKARTNEQMVSMALSANSFKLSQKEFLNAANVCQDLAKKETILKAYIDTFPNDWRGYNNLGAVHVANAKLPEAKTQFEKANALDQNNGMVLNNLGAVAMGMGDFKAAEDYFNKAKEAGVSGATDYNLGVIRIQQAQYNEAVQLFGSDASFNASLAQLLNKDAAAAKSTIDKVTCEKAHFFYLKAVVEARNDNKDGVIENLTKAVEKDGSLKSYAKNDLEFVKFRTEADFKNITE